MKEGEGNVMAGNSDLAKQHEASAQGQKDPGQDQVNAIILGLEHIDVEGETTGTQRIEKTTYGKVKDVIKWSCAFVAGFYV